MVVERASVQHKALLIASLAMAAAIVLWGSRLPIFEQDQFTRVMIYAIAIAGLSLATGYTGLLSVGHSAFFGLGAYTTGILVVRQAWEAWATIPVAFAVCLVAGLFVGLPALRIRGLYLAMVTIAFAVAFPEIIARFETLTGGASGMTIPRTSLRPPEWSGFTLGEKGQWLYWVAVLVLVGTIYMTACLTRSRYGLAMAAVRENEIAASASGVNIAVVKTVVFGLSGGITGAAGALFAMYLGNLYAEGSFTLFAGITLLIGLIIGGERNILGPIIGGLMVVYIPYYTSDIGGGQASSVLFAVVLLIVIFVAPSGVIGGMATMVERYLVVRPARSVTREQDTEGPTTSPRSLTRRALRVSDRSSSPTERQNL